MDSDFVNREDCEQHRDEIEIKIKDEVESFKRDIERILDNRKVCFDKKDDDLANCYRMLDVKIDQKILGIEIKVDKKIDTVDKKIDKVIWWLMGIMVAIILSFISMTATVIIAIWGIP